VVADRRLGAAGWPNEVTGADLPAGGRGDHREQAQSGWIGERSERAGQGLGLVGVEDVGTDGSAAELGLDGLTGSADTHKHIISSNVNAVH